MGNVVLVFLTLCIRCVYTSMLALMSADRHTNWDMNILHAFLCSCHLFLYKYMHVHGRLKLLEHLPDLYINPKAMEFHILSAHYRNQCRVAVSSQNGDST